MLSSTSHIQSSTPYPDMKSLHILVADDHAANRLFAENLLQRQGHKVMLAVNGRTALDLALEQSFGLILLDIQMPIMDGLTAFNQIRARKGPNQNTPIFALTAYASKPEQAQYRAAGLTIILTKPLRSGDITKAWIDYHGAQHKKLYVPMQEEESDNPVRLSLIDEVLFGRLLDATSMDTMWQLAQSTLSCCHTLSMEIKTLQHDAMNEDLDALDQLRKAAHGIKGAAINLGILRLSRLAAKLQNAPPGQITYWAGLMHMTFIQSEKAIEHRLSSSAAAWQFTRPVKMRG